MQCVYRFRMTLTINTDYFSKQHEHVYLCGVGVSFV